MTFWSGVTLIIGRLEQREEKDKDRQELGLLTHVQNGRERAKAKTGDGIAPRK